MVGTPERLFDKRRTKMGKRRLLPICALLGERKPRTDFIMALRLLQAVVRDYHVFQSDFPIHHENGRPVSLTLTLWFGGKPVVYSVESDYIGVVSEKLWVGGELSYDRWIHPFSWGMRYQELMLERAAKSGIPGAMEVYDWLINKLVILAPDSRLDLFDECNYKISCRFNADLMPMFADVLMPGADKTYVVDGFEQFLGRSTAESMIDEYLSQCGAGTRTQLLLCFDTDGMVNRRRFRMDERWMFGKGVLSRLK